MAAEQKHEMRLKILAEQADRARAALFFAGRARIRSIYLGSLTMVVLLLLGYTRYLPMAAMALPFAAVFLVVLQGYFSHRVNFARTCVAELEAKINADLGETLLITEALESKDLGPLGESHFLGICPSNLRGIFSILSIHYLVIGLGMFIAGLFRTHYILSQPDLRPVERFGDIYAPVLFIWAVANILYLIWFSWGEAEKGVIAAIRKQFQPKGE